MEVKSFWKTSEFWMSLTVILVGVGLSSGLIETGSTMEKVFALISSALAALGYTGARALAKLNPQPAAAPPAEPAE